MPRGYKWQTEEERKAARNKSIKEWRERNRKIVSGWSLDAYHKNKQKYNAMNRRYVLKRKYGISSEEYESMFEKQGKCCAICRGLNKSGKRLAVDHDHKTGQVRGLLCSRCNTMIGHARDNVRLLKAACFYLGMGRWIDSVWKVAA